MVKYYKLFQNRF